MKMNQKGFAISTVLYGILMMAMLIMTLLIGTMAFSRKSNVDFVNKIEEELNRCMVMPTDPNC